MHSFREDRLITDRLITVLRQAAIVVRNPDAVPNPMNQGQPRRGTPDALLPIRVNLGTLLWNVVPGTAAVQ